METLLQWMSRMRTMWVICMCFIVDIPPQTDERPIATTTNRVGKKSTLFIPVAMSLSCNNVEHYVSQHTSAVSSLLFKDGQGNTALFPVRNLQEFWHSQLLRSRGFVVRKLRKDGCRSQLAWWQGSLRWRSKIQCNQNGSQHVIPRASTTTVRYVNYRGSQ